MTRNDWLRTALVLGYSVLTLAACDDDAIGARDSGSDASSDASQDAMADSAADAHVPSDAAIEDLPCSALESAWRTFVNANNSCSRDEDCAVFERLFDHQFACEDPRGLQASIHPTAIADAERFATRVGSIECLARSTWSHVGFDGYYFQTPRCDAGRCWASGPACGSDPDAGL